MKKRLSAATVAILITQFPQVIEGEDASRMAIAPNRLNAIAANALKAAQAERLRRQLLFRGFVQVAHDIRFALAARARASLAKSPQRNVALRAVIPFDSHFFPDDLNVQWLHRLNIAGDRLGSRRSEHAFIDARATFMYYADSSKRTFHVAW